ncbi:MAG: GNAT family N-acetyltransferase [Rickettsiales bacterium]|jgi:RimJ/RimL family protein N-acetyltransferase|nr:GNAT family N-acetyltransferase [Rickettsiales bacterium]
MTDFSEILKDGDLELRRLSATKDNAAMLFDGTERERFDAVFGAFWIKEFKMDTLDGLYKWLERCDGRNNNDTPFRKGRLYGIFAGSDPNAGSGRNAGCDYAGFVDFFNMDADVKKAEISYYLRQRFEGRGLASRAIRLVEDEFFGKIGWNKIVIGFADSNKKSESVAKRNGYRQEGFLRDECVVGGVLRNRILTGKLKSEWVAARG